MKQAAADEFFELLKIPQAKRDHVWEKNFARVLPFGKFNLLYDDAKPGPDGWPYLFAIATPEGTEFGAQILNWLSTRGIGLAINPEQSMPDFVLTYGMTWNFKERGSIVTDESAAAKASRPQTTRLEFKEGDKVYVGQPSEAYLPGYVRKILKQFFLDQGVMAPKMAIIQSDDKNNEQTQTDLAFSLESLGEPTADEHAGVAEALAWFLPAHYSIALVSEKVIKGFQPIS